MCYVIWPRNLLLFSVFGHGKFSLRATGFRDEHGLTLRAILQLTRRSVMARGSRYWNEIFRNIRNFCFIFWDSVQKSEDPFVKTWGMNWVRSAEIMWT